MTRVYGCQLVGIGPGCLGVLLAADRLGVLTTLLDRGMAVVDRLPEGRQLGGSGLAYAISSNSRGGELIAGIAENGAFADALGSISGRRVRASQGEPLRLIHAARFFNALALRACDMLHRHDAGTVLTGRAVASVVIEPRGRISTRDPHGQTIAVSRTIVLSPGACQHQGGPVAALLPAGLPQPVVGSDRLLRLGGGEVVRRLRLGTVRTAAVIGGSHSAFSVALTLVRRAGRHLEPRAVRIVHRKPVRHYYGSLAEARRLRIAQEPLVVCPDTGIVNRFDGLRGEAAAFSRLVLTGGEPRVSLIREEARTGNLNDAAANADILVDATGYDAPPLTFLDAAGRALDIDRRRGFPVDGRNRLLRSDGLPIEGIYVTGLARRYASPAPPALRAIGAGAGVFQQTDGVTIVRDLVGGLPSAP